MKQPLRPTLPPPLPPSQAEATTIRVMALTLDTWIEQYGAAAVLEALAASLGAAAHESDPTPQRYGALTVSADAALTMSRILRQTEQE